MHAYFDDGIGGLYEEDEFKEEALPTREEVIIEEIYEDILEDSIDLSDLDLEEFKVQDIIHETNTKEGYISILEHEESVSEQSDISFTEGYEKGRASVIQGILGNIDQWLSSIGDCK